MSREKLNLSHANPREVDNSKWSVICDGKGGETAVRGRSVCTQKGLGEICKPEILNPQEDLLNLAIGLDL